jgi:hypothetical protein
MTCDSKLHDLNSLAAFVNKLEQSGKLYPSSYRA